MNVTMEKNGNVSGVITVSLTEQDYKDKVKKDLKAIGQKHHIDGFRAGKVPEGLLRKMFGKQVLADVVNRETVDALFKYIEDNKLSILGEPLSANETKEVDFTHHRDPPDVGIQHHAPLVHPRPDAVSDTEFWGGAAVSAFRRGGPGCAPHRHDHPNVPLHHPPGDGAGLCAHRHLPGQ